MSAAGSHALADRSVAAPMARTGDDDSQSSVLTGPQVQIGGVGPRCRACRAIAFFPGISARLAATKRQGRETIAGFRSGTDFMIASNPPAIAHQVTA